MYLCEDSSPELNFLNSQKILFLKEYNFLVIFNPKNLPDNIGCRKPVDHLQGQLEYLNHHCLNWMY